MKWLKNVPRLIQLFAFFIIVMISVTPIARTVAASNYSLENGVIKLANAAYEVRLSAKDGGIIGITDQATKQTISSGSVGGNLWSNAPPNLALMPRVIISIFISI